MRITFRCKEEEFKDIELFLFSQEYLERPEFDIIELYVGENTVYSYCVKQAFGKWYITI